MRAELKARIIGFLAWLSGSTAEERRNPEVTEAAQALLDEIDADEDLP